MKLFRLVHAEARQGAADFCLSAPDGWAVTFAPYEQLRSLEANAAYWAWIHEVCDAGVQDSEGKPFTADRLHRILKRKHLGKFIRVMPNGDTEEMEATTTRLTAKEFSAYMGRCQAWIAEVTA
jgi:hypothetical protein